VYRSVEEGGKECRDVQRVERVPLLPRMQSTSSCSGDSSSTSSASRTEDREDREDREDGPWEAWEDGGASVLSLSLLLDPDPDPTKLPKIPRRSVKRRDADAVETSAFDAADIRQISKKATREIRHSTDRERLHIV
jgi:hypothetical protein